MSTGDDEPLVFLEEDEPGAPATEPGWVVLIVDDDRDVHDVTRLALSDLRFEGRGLRFFSAYSSSEAQELFALHPDAAVVLLDVVMERDDAGLRLVRWLRGDAGRLDLRIVLRTGQPGLVPERAVMVDYDINDYQTKTDLTAQRLFTVLLNALRAYRDLQRLQRSRADLDARNAELSRTNDVIGRFVPYEFLRLLGRTGVCDVRHGDSVAIEAAVMFCDLREFSSLAERSGPEETFRFINAYLARMEPEIYRQGGVVLEYMGDGILALFAGGPEAAVRAGVAQLHALEAHNAERARTGAPRLAMGIGIESGELMLGIIGGGDHLKAGVVGDIVNLAARIEALTRRYGAPLLVGDRAAAGLAASDLALREIDRVIVKGRCEPTRLFEVLDADPPDVRAAKLRAAPTFEQALARYREGGIAEARELFERCAAGGSDSVARTYLPRCDELLAKGTPPGWDGVAVLDRKMG